MMIHAKIDERFWPERIFDTATGIVYACGIGYPAGILFDEAEREGKTFRKVSVYSVHVLGENSSPLVYEGKAAERFWELLVDMTQREGVYDW